MDDQPRTPFLASYLLVLVLSMVALMVVGRLLSLSFGISVLNGGTVIIPPIAASLFAGQKWGRAEGAVPEMNRIIRFALVAGVAMVALAIPIMLLLVLATSQGAPTPQVLVGTAGMALGVVAVSTILTGLFVNMGARMAMRGT